MDLCNRGRCTLPAAAVQGCGHYGRAVVSITSCCQSTSCRNVEKFAVVSMFSLKPAASAALLSPFALIAFSIKDWSFSSHGILGSPFEQRIAVRTDRVLWFTEKSCRKLQKTGGKKKAAFIPHSMLLHTATC